MKDISTKSTVHYNTLERKRHEIFAKRHEIFASKYTSMILANNFYPCKFIV